MCYFRLIFIYLFFICGSISGYALSPDVPLFSDIEINSQLSEDTQELSPSHLASISFLEGKVYFPPMYIPAGIKFTEDFRELAYFSTNRFIIPGLSHPDIIFPFHTFL